MMDVDLKIEDEKRDLLARLSETGSTEGTKEDEVPEFIDEAPSMEGKLKEAAG